MNTVGLVTHPDYLKHETGLDHPERADRLRAINDRLETTGLAHELKYFKPKQIDSFWLEKIHTPTHIANVKARSEKGLSYMEDLETKLCPFSFDVAKLATGGAFAAIDAVMKKQAETVFCAIRPPGHHAEKNRAMGFCLFNTVAITARYIQETFNLERIAILDWDVHHGNGTQHLFEQDHTVFYFSIHQYPHYPGTGNINETGIGLGKGSTLNVPVEAGAGDDQYLRAFDEKLIPALEFFQPEFLIISAGFDAHTSDPLSATQVTETGFREMTRRTLSIAKTFSKGRLISVLEGGYNLESLSKSVAVHLQELMET